MREDFRKLKQGNRTVREYEWEFTHLLNCVPDVARTEKDQAECFVLGLRPGIFRMVHAFKFRTFAKVLDRALCVEHGNACEREEHKAFEKDKGKKRPGGAVLYLWWGHRAAQCGQWRGKCFTCGQEGHMSHDCPVRAPSVASAPATPAHYGGAPPLATSAGRTMALRQPEVTRSAPSGRVFAAQAEEPAEPEERNVVAGSDSQVPGDVRLVSLACHPDPGSAETLLTLPAGNWL
uniref:CCHC-type domain-containing protein n=1 Tax=Ananas comosus var. bracteatus TaxID=296719 RepID=A0A6V7Q412_ANACO|nr:unnamed protein product [Ananas comosus var. bracteatus]